MPVSPVLDLSTYTLTFADEFDGTRLNAWEGHGSDGLWATSFSPHLDDTRTLSSNGESQWYVDADDAASPFEVANGVLTITASEVAEEDRAATGGLPYTSGLLTTEMTFAAEEGYFEVRADLPDVAGFLSAFWLLPADGDWSAEIDLFEQLGGALETVNMNLWDAGVPDEARAVVEGLADGFHTFGLMWTADAIRWFVDGVLLHSVANTVVEPMYLALSLALGTDWTGPVAEDADLSEGFAIDYVRVYEQGENTDTVLHDGTHGADTLYGTRWGDEMRGRKGDDVIYGRDGDDVLKGNRGEDELFGGAGDDRLKGGKDADKLWGGTGDDRLVGGQGNDNLWGGDGADIFVFKAGHGADLVHDFEAGIDHVHLRRFDTDWDTVQGALEDQGWAVVIDLAALGGAEGDRVTLVGLSLEELSAGDFLF